MPSASGDPREILKKKMKLYQVDSWVDSRPVLSSEQVRAGQFKTAFNRAAWMTRQRSHYPGRRHPDQMTIRVTYVGQEKKTVQASAQ